MTMANSQNANVPALSPDALMEAVVMLLPFFPPSTELGVQFLHKVSSRSHEHNIALKVVLFEVVKYVSYLRKEPVDI